MFSNNISQNIDFRNIKSQAVMHEFIFQRALHICTYANFI